MSPEVYDWIDEAVRWQGTPREGAFSTLDGSGIEVERRTFDNLAIQRVVFPALDVHSTAPVALTVDIAGATQVAAPSLNVVAATIGPKQKAWVASNFKLEIDGMPTLHVAKIDSFTWKQQVKVVLHMHAADAAPLRAWKKAAEAPGAPLGVREKEGRLAFEAIDGTRLFLLEVAGVTPNAIAPEALVIEGETFDGARIELGVASGSLEALPAATAPGGAARGLSGPPGGSPATASAPDTRSGSRRSW